MKAGPKAAVDTSPLPYKPRSTGSVRFASWCKRFLRVPKGVGVNKPLQLHDWQRELIGSILDAKPRPRLAAWTLPRGQGKTTLLAALALYELFNGPDGANVICVAVDERQANLLFQTAVRFVELNDDLSSRCVLFRDKIVIPARGASMHVLPAEAKRLEGLDFTLCCLDEVGVVARDTYETLLLASGKRPESTLVGIGTPGADPDNVLADLRSQWQAGPADPSFVFVEYSAAGYEEHPVDCQHCWELANPALDTFLARDALVALLPPRTREASFRRARLCQPVTGSGDSFLTPATWQGCLDETRTIAAGSPVVLGLDGSFNNDTTAVVAVSVEAHPRIEVVGVWTPPPSDPSYRVPILDVEQTIRQAAKTYAVRELTADPFRWARTLELLADEGLTVSEFPQTAQRMSPATKDFETAAFNVEFTHTGNKTLTAHVLNAVIVDDSRGVRVQKVSRHSARKIDALVATLMAYQRAKWHAGQKPKSKKVYAFT